MVDSVGDPWRVLIVEDDPVISSIYERVVSGMSRFEAVGVVTRGEDAIEFLKRKRADLMLLDLKLAGMNGLTLVQNLRSSGHSIEVIAVTASRNTNVVRSVVHCGAVDYLVKPFPPERLRRALSLFVHRAAAMRTPELDQASVDEICSSGRKSGRWLPRGLRHEGVAQVRDILADAPEELSAAQIATRTGLARVTSRRYLEYLVANGEASVHAYPLGPGRPRKVYRLCEWPGGLTQNPSRTK